MYLLTYLLTYQLSVSTLLLNKIECDQTGDQHAFSTRKSAKWTKLTVLPACSVAIAICTEMWSVSQVYIPLMHTFTEIGFLLCIFF